MTRNATMEGVVDDPLLVQSKSVVWRGKKSNPLLVHPPGIAGVGVPPQLRDDPVAKRSLHNVIITKALGILQKSAHLMASTGLDPMAFQSGQEIRPGTLLRTVGKPKIRHQPPSL